MNTSTLPPPPTVGPPATRRLSTRGRLVDAMVGVTVAVALVACSKADQLPPPPAIVGVRMDEYRFVLESSIPAGRVVFEARNVGAVEHELSLISIPEDFSLTIDQQVRSPVREAFPTKAILAARPPGGVGEFAVDLSPGRYALVCFVKNADGESHAVKGMTAEVRIR